MKPREYAAREPAVNTITLLHTHARVRVGAGRAVFKSSVLCALIERRLLLYVQ